MKGALPEGYIRPSELVVWRMVALGRHTREIAHELRVSPKTIGKHRAELCRKLRVSSPADLARKAVEHAVITVEVRPLTVVEIPGYLTRHMLPTTP